MILLLFLYDPLYASSHDLESDYPWSGLKDENSPTPESFKTDYSCKPSCGALSAKRKKSVWITFCAHPAYIHVFDQNSCFAKLFTTYRPEIKMIPIVLIFIYIILYQEVGSSF